MTSDISQIEALIYLEFLTMCILFMNCGIASEIYVKAEIFMISKIWRYFDAVALKIDIAPSANYL